MQEQQNSPGPLEMPATPKPEEDVLDLTIDIAPLLPEQVQPAWYFLQDYPLLLVLIMFALGWGVGKLIQWVLHTLLNKAARRTSNEVDDHLIDYLTAPVVQTTVILALVAATKAFGLSEQMDWVVVRILFSLLLLFWGRAWFKATALLIQSLANDVGRFTMFQPRTRPLFEMGIKLFLVTLLIWFFMTLWNIDGTAWLASAGVIGIAVGFAAKDTLANLISGVSIIADAPYKIGDYIVLDTGERGVVTELGMRSTRLLTRDDVEISIPNAVMGNAKITNESGGPAVEHRIRIPVGVAYGTKPARVVEVLEQIANENELTVKEPAPRASMRGFADSSINFELLSWIRLPEQRGLVQHQILMEVERRFAEEGIHIPFPQRDIHIRSGALGAERGEPG